MNQGQEEIKKEGISQKINNKKKLILSIFIVLCALVCFSLSIFAMYSAVLYFSYMFSLTSQVYAKAYLQQHYSWYMAITYSSIFGFVIVISNTAVHFSSFSQKQRIIWIHLIYYLIMIICGIVALVSDPSYTAQMTSLLTQTCGINFQCLLSLRYFIYRGQVMTYFIGYCICFFLYAALYHYASYIEKREKQQAMGNKLQDNHSQNLEQSIQNKHKNLSVHSNDENSL